MNKPDVAPMKKENNYEYIIKLSLMPQKFQSFKKN